MIQVVALCVNTISRRWLPIAPIDRGAGLLQFEAAHTGWGIENASIILKYLTKSERPSPAARVPNVN
jgi:hypothetical protein